MVNNIIKNGGSPRLAEAAYNILSTALNKAADSELIVKLPFKSVELPQKIKNEFVPLTPEEWALLFKAAKPSTTMYTLLKLEWATGLSRSELLGLKWQDLNWDLGVISIVRATIITPDGPIFHNTKSASRRRVLPLPTIVLDELKQHRTRQIAERLSTREWNDMDIIFPTNVGNMQDPRNWSKKFAKLRKDAGLTVTFHQLRHDHASKLAEQGTAIKDAQYRLGHSTSRMLLDVYTHRMTGGQEKNCCLAK